MGRAETGQRGEAAAARFYQKQGAELLGHNYHTRMGEIDLILREPDGTLVFCEVKTRAKDSLDTPAAAVNAAKQTVKRDDLSHVETHRFVALTGALEIQCGRCDDTPLRWMVHIIKGAFWAKS